MQDIPTVATWAAVALAAIVFAAAVVRRKWSRRDAAERGRAERRNAYIAALEEWQDSVERGDAEGARRLKLDIDRMRRDGWHLVAAAALAIAVSGCRSPAPPPEPVVLSAHLQIVAPGDTVPPLPGGEPRWWLATPTGLGLLLPADAPVLVQEESRRRKPRKEGK